jgi:ABC-type multidrug transport system ATPase subunit
VICGETFIGQQCRAGSEKVMPMQGTEARVPGEGLLHLRAVEKRWGANHVLRSIDLRLEAGHLLRVKGANGAGKTTMLRIASGLIRPDGGAVALSGLDPERDRRAYLSRLGFVTAGDRGLYPRLSVRRHLLLGADLGLLAADERAAAVERTIEAFAMGGFADRVAQRLSLGQRQRAKLALAFLHEPDVVLLDEPANSLDDDGIALLAANLEALRGRGGAALWCAPSATDPPLPFDDRLVLRDGSLQPE